MNVQMKKYGEVLSTRLSGREAFEDIRPLLLSGSMVTFDFTGVASVTNSFADELFGRLALEFGIGLLREMTTFDAIDSFSALSIRRAMDRRAATPEPCMA